MTPTPRPWTYELHASERFLGDGHSKWPVAEVRTVIGKLVGCGTSDDKAEAEANAFLIVRAVNVEPKVRELVDRIVNEQDNGKPLESLMDWGFLFAELAILARSIKAELEGENG